MDWSSKEIGKFYLIDIMNPLVATVNMAIPFVVSIIEDYFRSTYTALLKYSSQKEVILKGCRIQGEDLVLLEKEEITLEDAIARSRSFQNMKRIGQSFKELDNNIDLFGVLNKTLRRRKPVSDTFERIIGFWHRIIHRAELIYDYAPKALLCDIRTIHVGVEKFYFSLINLYGWSDEHPDLRRKI